jgi:hypothetical protein
MPDDLRQLYLVLGGGFPTPMGKRQRRSYIFTGGNTKLPAGTGARSIMRFSWTGKASVARYPFGFRGGVGLLFDQVVTVEGAARSSATTNSSATLAVL